MDQCAEQLAKSAVVAVITGAGISAESGVPTFRGQGGLWRTHRAEDLATPEAFARNPHLIWEWYDWRRGICAQAVPNLAHGAVEHMERQIADFLLITQNVDNLHRRAGSRRLIEIHGNIFQGRCTLCHHIAQLDLTPLPNCPPLCPLCRAMLRPNVVWFGEQYPPGVLEQCYSFLRRAETVVVIGTSGAVATPVHMALFAAQQGAFTIEINTNASELTAAVHCFLQGRAGDVLPALWHRARKLMK